MQSILQFAPIYKPKIWGGQKLKTLFQRPISNDKIGESWEISDHRKDVSIIQNGKLKGLTLREVYLRDKISIFGDCAERFESFPLLIKWIDAMDILSVQVHPNDAYAQKNGEPFGKKEAWWIYQADPNAMIYCGFSTKTNADEFRKLVQENLAEKPLQRYFVQANDAFILNPGTIHAIGAGCFLLEVQQSSDATYRVYDYGRLGDDGKPRDLHLDKAIEVLNFSQAQDEKLCPISIDWKFGQRHLIVSNDKFRIEQLEFTQNISIPNMYHENFFQVVTILDGNGHFSEDAIAYKSGDTFLITAIGMKREVQIFPKQRTKLALIGI